MQKSMTLKWFATKSHKEENALRVMSKNCAILSNVSFIEFINILGIL